MTYGPSARHYDAIYDFKDYALESDRVHHWIERRSPGARTLLDAGCGTGRHLEHLRARYDAVGLDINPELLAAARRRCPEVEFHEASMTDFRLNRRFDVVVVLFSAIACAVRTVDGLQRTVSNLSEHVADGGVLIVEPWFTPETYRTGTITANFAEQPDLKISWMYTSTVEEGASLLDIHYLVGTPRSVEHFRERQLLGLFRHEEYLDSFRNAGLDVEREEGFGRGMYFGRKG